MPVLLHTGINLQFYKVNCTFHHKKNTFYDCRGFVLEIVGSLETRTLRKTAEESAPIMSTKRSGSTSFTVVTSALS